VLVDFGVGDDAVAVAGLERGVDLLDVLEDGQGLVVAAGAGVVDGEELRISGSSGAISRAAR